VAPGGVDCRFHEPAADAAALMGGAHADWRERQRPHWPSVDCGFKTAQHRVTDDGTAGVRHQRSDGVPLIEEARNQLRLVVAPESAAYDIDDRFAILCGGLADHHRCGRHGRAPRLTSP
jgi:hypothetical protein